MINHGYTVWVTGAALKKSEGWMVRGTSRYLLALVAAATAMLLRFALDPYVAGVQFITFFPAVILVAYVAGSGPALSTAWLCGLGAWYLVVPPYRSLEIERSADLVALILYFTISTVIAIAVAGMRGALMRERQLKTALTQSEARLRSLTGNLPGGLVYQIKAGREPHDRHFTYVSDSCHALTGVTAQEAMADASSLYRQLILDDPGQWAALEEAAMESGRFDQEVRFRHAGGEIRWCRIISAPRQVDDGVVWDGLQIDITERKRFEEHQELLINELNHRVKNTLAIVQAVAQQTFRPGVDPAEARGAFEGRLGAIAAAHNVLTRQNWAPVPIREVIENAALGLRPGDHRIVLDGPDLDVPPKTAVSLGMAVHELATNAVKYGSLSNDGGQVRIDWQADGGRLRFRWIESGGPEVAAPSRRGFGTRMIERGLAAELGGSVSMDWQPSGLVCTVEAALPS